MLIIITEQQRQEYLEAVELRERDVLTLDSDQFFWIDTHEFTPSEGGCGLEAV